MSQLAQLQQAFQAYLLDDRLKAPRDFIVNDAKVGAKKRLGIYHNAYRLRIVEALASAYGNVRKLLGDADFSDIARGYLRKYPSQHPNLRWYGANFAAYLKAHFAKLPIAAELAKFEWAMSITFDSQDAPTLSLQDLAAIAPETWGDLRFGFHAGVQFITLQYNTVAVWKALEADKKAPASKTAQHQLWLIWRQHLNVNFRSIADDEAAALRLMMNGASFGELCESLFQTLGDGATNQAAQYLACWLEAVLLSELRS